MVFGEIVEPSTRALINDEYEEYPEYVEPTIEWSGDCEFPNKINNLIFIETEKVKQLFKSLIIGSTKYKCSLLNAYLEVYKLPNFDYLISYTEKEFSTGIIVDLLSKYIKAAKQIYAFTSAPLTAYQTSLNNQPESFIRMLSTSKNNENLCTRLESPNLVSGLGAQVLSFAVHADLEASLFILYMDSSPIDSINAKPFIDLAKKLGLSLHSSRFVQSLPSNNLYL